MQRMGRKCNGCRTESSTGLARHSLAQDEICYLCASSGADESGVEGARDGDVGGSLYDGATVGEEGEGERTAAEAENKVVAAESLNVRVSAETGLERGEVDGPVVLVDLHGVSAAEGDVGAILAGEMSENALAAYVAVGAG